MNPSAIIDDVVNCSTAGRVEPDRLAAIARTGRFEAVEAPQVIALLTEVDLGSLVAWLAQASVAPADLGRTYAAVRDRYGEFNPRIEAWLADQV